MSGPGRRRKPNPDEETGGSLPAPPRPPAGYPQPDQGQGQGQEQPPGYAYGYGYEREYDGYSWPHQPPSSSLSPSQPQPSAPSAPHPTAQPDLPPGPVFDAFSTPPSPYSPPQPPPPPPSRPSTGANQSSYYNPVGYGLSDPYSPTGYASPPPATAPPPSLPTPASPPPPTPAPTPSPSAATPPATSPSEPSGFFDADDLFDFDTDSSASPSASTPPPASAPQAPPAASSTTINPVVPPPSADAPRPQDGYTAADFAFLDEETGHDVKGWLTFVASRADSRADRLKRFRVQLIAIATAVVVVAVGIGAYFLLGGGGLGGNGPTKSVVLFQVSDSTGNAVADALLVTDLSNPSSGASATKTASGTGAAVLIPSQMEVNTVGFGLQPFGGNMAQSIPAADKGTIADTFGVSIDGVWRMDEVTLAGLIDEIGGIQLTANTSVPAVTTTPTAAAIPSGAGKLTGGQAVAYATYSAKGDAPSAQSERFGQVVAGLLAALPTDPIAITAYLNHLGIVDDPALPDSKLSPILASLAAQQQAGAFTAKVLPVRTDGSNELDVQAAAPIVSSLLGGALTAGTPGEVSRVLVEDATGSSGMRSQAVRGAAQAKLANSGYTFLDGSTVAYRSTSVVEVGSNAQKDGAVQVAETLGLQPNSVQVDSGMSTFADVTVILGADWPKLANITLPAN